MGDFFMYVSALGAVILIFAIITYYRAKKSIGRTSAVQKDYDWLYLVMAILLIVLVLIGLLFTASKNQEKENNRPVEEKLHTEEFSYKGHQYIMFRTNSRLDGASVLHDPNCGCHLKTDSI